MNLNFSNLKLIACLLLIPLISCKKTEKSSGQVDSSSENEVVQEVVETETLDFKSSHTTKSGKTFDIRTESNGSSIMSISLSSSGFSESDDTWLIEEVDPLTASFTADLDNNGFEELYLITTSAGSGSYGSIYAFGSNNDKSITQIYVPEISESDMSTGSHFAGYMGHDSIFLDQGRLYRKFPVYLEGDENCCPSGGNRQLEYSLEPGENSMVLKVSD